MKGISIFNTISSFIFKIILKFNTFLLIGQKKDINHLFTLIHSLEILLALK